MGKISRMLLGKTCFTAGFIVFTLLPFLSFSAESGASAQEDLSAIFLGLGFLAFISIGVIGLLAYLWHRHSKYKKQKVILDI